MKTHRAAVAVAIAVTTTTALLATPGVLAEPPDAVVHTSTSDVQACAPIEEGAVLAGTSGGLVLLDGALRTIRRWTAADGLPGTRVHALLAEPGKGVWVGTEGGLAHLVGEGTRLALEEAIPGPPIRDLVRQGGAIYAATWGAGVVRLREGGELDPVWGEDAMPSVFATRHVHALAVYDGALIAGTAGAGLLRIEGDVARPLPAELPSEMVFSLAAAGGRLAVGTLAGLVLYDGRRWRSPAGDDVRALAVETEAERLVIATYGAGVASSGLDGSGRRAVEGLPATYARDVSIRGRRACVATGEGVLVSEAGLVGPWRRALAGGLPSSDVTSLAWDGSRLWAGTFDTGLAVREGGRWRSYDESAIDERVNALAVGRSALWVGTTRGLFRLREARPAERLGTEDGLPSDHILSLTPLRDGGILAGTERGAVIVRDGAERRIEVLGRKQGLRIRGVWAVAEDGGGRLWLGTSSGLIRRDPDGSWRRLSVAGGQLRDDWVTALALDGDGLWVGTYARGVTRLDPDGAGGYRARHLGGGYVNPGGLFFDRGRGALYAATMDGLLVRPASGEGGWGPAHLALPGEDVTMAARTPEGLWVATRRGLVECRGESYNM